MPVPTGVAERAGAVATRLWPVLLVATLIVTAVTFFVQPHVLESLAA